MPRWCALARRRDTPETELRHTIRNRRAELTACGTHEAAYGDLENVATLET